MNVLKVASDWIVALSGVVLIAVGVTARRIPELHGYGTLGIVIGAIALGTWVIALLAFQSRAMKAASKKADKDELIAGITANKELFGHEVLLAAASGGDAVKAIITLVNAEFDRLGALANSDDPNDFEELSDQAGELFAYRALFASEPELPELNVMTYEALSELAEWGVPLAIRSDYEAKIAAAKAGNADEWRQWVMMLLRQHAGWDSYVSWFNGFLGRVTFLLVLILFACLIEGVLQLVLGMTVLGLLFLGTAGAIVSILFSLPRVSSHEEVNAWIFHIVSRVVTGIAGSYIGWGLLTSKIVSFSLNGTDVQAHLADCARACDAQNLLIAGAIGMLMGFSERLLPDLDARFFNSTNKTPPSTSATSPPVAPVNPPGGGGKSAAANAGSSGSKTGEG